MRNIEEIRKEMNERNQKTTFLKVDTQNIYDHVDDMNENIRKFRETNRKSQFINDRTLSRTFNF